MEYQFSFDKKRLFLLSLALVLAFVLIFAGGVITGIGLLKSGSHEPGVASSGSPSGLKVPGVPSVTAPKLTAPTVSAAGVTGPNVTAPAVTMPAVPGVVPTAAAAVAPGGTPQAAAPPPQAAVPGAAPAAGATPALAASAEAAIPNPADSPFILQLGAFREQKDAKKLQADLKAKGYATIIFNMVDEDQRTWHMVRLGGYKDINAASHAASDFTGKEGIQALVRRSDSL